MVQFKTNMPKDHAVWLTLTIEDSLGMIFADGFMIKKGEYLPGFIAPMAMKDLVRGYARQGYAVYLPQGNLNYKDFTGTGFAANDLEQAGGEGMSSWYTFEEWWERFGSSCVHMWLMDLPRPVAEAYWQGALLDIEGEIETPQDQAAFPIGDTIVIRIHNEARWIEEGSLVIYPWNEELVWNTSEPPNLAGEWIPAAYQMWIEEYDYTRGWIYEADETRIWWLFTLKIRENLVKKYFNPLKPDSARVVYELLPMQYADPDVAPNPIKMEVEIRDCDSNVVYGPTELSYSNQKSQVCWWNGKDNAGKYTDPEKSPYLATITLTYRGIKESRANNVKIYTKTSNAPTFIDVPILTRFTPYIETPSDTTRYMDILFGNSCPLYFSTVILTKESNTGTPQNDYHCYHPNNSGYQVIIHRPEWNNLPVEFTVEKWNELLWGKLYPIRWCEVRPKIYNDDQDRVNYPNSVLGEWYIPIIGFGWGWQENQKEMSEGTLRYSVHVENWDVQGHIQQEATTPRGIDLFRVSTRGNYPTSEIVKWASSYHGVPYVLLTYPPPNGRNIYYDSLDPDIKTKIAKYRKRGYEGLDCSGLAGWSYIWAGEDIDNNPATVDSTDIDNTGTDLLETYYGKVNLTKEDATDGDMWLIDGNEDGFITHVGIYVKINDEDGVIHASADVDKVVKELFSTSAVDWRAWWAGDVQGQAGLGRIPHNYKETK